MPKKCATSSTPVLKQIYWGVDIPIRVIRRFALAVAERFHPDKIILFGSHAYGTPTEDSDVDILVIEPEVDNATEEAVRLYRTLKDLRIPVDVLVIDEAKARRRAKVKGTVVERALREGRDLVS